MMSRSFSTSSLINTKITFGTVLLVVFGFSFMMPDMFATSLTYQTGNLALVIQALSCCHLLHSLLPLSRDG